MRRCADVAAGIVVFRPDADILLALARGLLAECGAVFIFVNALADRSLVAQLRAMGARVSESDVNLGIAEALNFLTLAAILSNARRVVLMDQDSRWPEGGVAKLAAALDLLIEAGETPAVIGPKIVAPDGYKPPRYFRVGREINAGAHAVRYIITSGSMLDLNAFRDVGPFRSDFFIDAVDTEWCFRAWARGRSCWVSRDVEMLHTIGQGVETSKALGTSIPRQPRVRLLAYLRNQTHCITLGHVPIKWKILLGLHLSRLFALLLLRREHGLAPAAGKAVWEGLVGRLGPPPGAEASAQLGDIRRLKVAGRTA